MDLSRLSYFILGEIVTFILSLLLTINIVTSFSPHEKRHRLFLYGSISSALATFFNILAVFCISYFPEIPLPLCTAVSTCYFTVLLIIPLVLCNYAIEVAVLSKDTKQVIFCINGTVYSIYLILVLLNIKTGWIFRYDLGSGYVRGPLKYMTYIITVYYMIVLVASVACNKKNIASRVYSVFLLYPFFSGIFIFIQLFFPKVLLTGASSFAALFISYISIQTDLLEYDIVTGLLTESSLKKQVQLKNNKGVLFAVVIDNYSIIQENMDISDLNLIMLNIGKEFTKFFYHSSYIINSNRFVGIAPNLEACKKSFAKISNYIEKLNKETENNLPTPFDPYYCAIEFSRGDKTYDHVIDIMNNLVAKAKMDLNHQLCICDESVLCSMERKKIIYNILKRELNPNSTQFEVWYQPIFSVQDGRFVYMEALSRLRGTELGDIPPQEFVEIAEKRGLIEKLGNVMFEKVCKFISENKEIIPAVSINFSVYQITNPSIVDTVLNMIKKYELSPSNVIMEITESIFIDNFELVKQNMMKLASSGIKFYLDDFGTGYSNLSNVVALPFSTIKMDRSLVLMMEKSEKNIQFFLNLVSTFKDAGLKILVEGVETQNQNYLVGKAGVDYIQGFLYSRPLPFDKCIEVMTEAKNSKML